MKPSLIYAAVFAVLATGNLPLSRGFAQGTAFTYQGRLNSGGSPAGGSYDFTFALFSGNNTNSGQLGVTQTNLALAVSNGLFLATLDFGSVFSGNPAWLAVGVRGAGESNFTTLTPLQAVTPAPYALYAPNAGTAASAGAVAANGVVPLAALPAAVLINGAAGVNLSGLFSGAFAGDGSGLTNSASAGVTSGNYVFAYDYPTNNGSIASGQTKPISFSTVANLSGWTCTTNTTFTCGQSGLYLVSYYALTVNNGGVGMFAYTPRTGQIIGSVGYTGVTGRISLAQSFMATFNAGDALQIQATPGPGGTVNFIGPAGFSGPDASLTIVRLQ